MSNRSDWRSACVWVVALVISTSPARAADEWNATFVPKALQTYLRGGPGGMVVVAAGGGEEVRRAAAGLRAAVAAGELALPLLDGEIVGGFDAANDATIVKRTRHLPVTRIVIVRVIDVARQPTAVVAMYDRGGRSVAGFSVSRGARLPPSSGSPATSGPTPSRTGGLRARLTPREEYARKHLAVIGLLAFQGMDRRLIWGERLYKAIGRPDLAASYERRRKARLGLLISGGIVNAVGLGLIARPLLSGSSSFADDPLFIAGVATLGVGTATLIVGACIPRHPVSWEEVVDLIDDSNDRLKERLGLPPGYRPRAEGGGAPSVDVMLAPVPHGALALVRGSY